MCCVSRLCFFRFASYLGKRVVAGCLFQNTPLGPRFMVQELWSMVHGSWSKDHGPWSDHHGPRIMVQGPWSMDYGPTTMVNGQWFMDHGPRTMVHGLWSKYHGPWIMAQRPWSKDYGRNTIVHGPRIMIQVRWVKDYGPSTMVHPCTDHGPMTMAAASPKPRETDLGSVWVPILCLSSLDLLMLSRCRKGRLGEGRSWEAAVPPTKKTTQVKKTLVFPQNIHIFSLPPPVK